MNPYSRDASSALTLANRLYEESRLGKLILLFLFLFTLGEKEHLHLLLFNLLVFFLICNYCCC